LGTRLVGAKTYLLILFSMLFCSHHRKLKRL
jgi:hypothetical protein